MEDAAYRTALGIAHNFSPRGGELGKVSLTALGLLISLRALRLLPGRHTLARR